MTHGALQPWYKISWFQEPMDTDGEIVEIQLLNDYMGSKVKDEMSDYETLGKIKVENFWKIYNNKTIFLITIYWWKIVPVCNACHGGEMDNPKGNMQVSF